MINDKDNAKVITRRAFAVGGLQLAFLGILGGRLAWLQISQGQRYKTLADKNRINIRMLAPSRGLIVDRYGTALAVNNQNFHALIVPEDARDSEKSLRSLQELIGIDEKVIQKVLRKISKTAKFVPVEIIDDLSWENVAKIEVNLPDLPGISIGVGEVRHYPYAKDTAHIVGYVGAVNKMEIKADPVLSLPGFKIGKTGIEKSFDKEMRGQSGSAQVEVNVIGREVRELQRNPSKHGKRVSLTIDMELQKFVQNRLEKETSASAVIMDAHTGAVYALASSPGFDPNAFTQGLSVDMWEGLLADPGHPLTNKAVAGQYPPGSTFKMVTAMAALEAGIINSKRRVSCPGYYEYGGDKFHCWKKSGHGSMNLETALAESCDTYFYKISTEIGINKISEMARRLGLGSKLDFELKEERPGLMPDKDWKMGHFGEHWRPGETIVASIGQSYTLTTPLQLAVMTARLVNGGYSVRPWMVGYVGNRPGLDMSWPKIGLKKWHMQLVIRGMNRSVNHESGTAFKSRILAPGMGMGGKTGTAQVRRITKEQRAAGIRNEDLPWEQRHHALFVGYAPTNKPRYVCSVVVEHGVGGSKAAAPLAKELLEKVQQRKPENAILQPENPKYMDSAFVAPMRKPERKKIWGR